MRSILLHIDNDDCLESRFQVALDLARAFKGHVSCLQAVPYELGVPGDLYGVMAAQMGPVLQEAADELRAKLEPRLAVEDVSWDFDQQDGMASERLLRRSGLSDVVVVGSCEPYAGKGPSTLAGEMVLRSRTPVLIVPAASKRLDCGGAAVVAWDGSPQAARALRSAVPLLALASSVTLVSISENKNGDAGLLPALDGAEYLSRHGIACELAQVDCDGSVSKTLLSEVAARQAAYLVMGSYGHARLLEVVWGGVTREVLTNPPVPVLTCH